MGGYRDEEETLRRRVAELERQLDADERGHSLRGDELGEKIRRLSEQNEALENALAAARAKPQNREDANRPSLRRRVRAGAFGLGVVCFGLLAVLGDADRVASNQLLLAGVGFLLVAVVVFLWDQIDGWLRPAAVPPRAKPQARPKHVRVDTSAEQRDPSVATGRSPKKRGRQRHR